MANVDGDRCPTLRFHPNFCTRATRHDTIPFAHQRQPHHRRSQCHQPEQSNPGQKTTLQTITKENGHLLWRG